MCQLRRPWAKSVVDWFPGWNGWYSGCERWHERNTALCALHERAALHARAETLGVVEMATGTFMEATRQVAGGGARVCVTGNENDFTNLSLVSYMDPTLSMWEV